jgi:hypothetical protein
VTAVVYFVSLTSYDLKLLEDPNVSSLSESLELWKEIIDSRWFAKVDGYILVFTKKDLLEKKIKSVPFKFQSVETQDAAEAIQAVINMFQVELSKLSSKPKFFPLAVSSFDPQDALKILEECQKL